MTGNANNPIDWEREGYRQAVAGLTLPQFACRENAGPVVVALEGPNGAGKTTLCAALSRALGAPCCLGIDSAWFSEAFKTRMIRDAEWHASAMFFLSGCFEQLRILRSRPDPLVIMDRSMWSTLAVHAAESASRLAALLDILKPIASQIQLPDLTIVLEASFTTCQSRIANKSGTDRALDELTAHAAFHAREQEFYHWLGQHVPTVTFLSVDSSTPEEASQKALSLISERGGRGFSKSKN